MLGYSTLTILHLGDWFLFLRCQRFSRSILQPSSGCTIPSALIVNLHYISFGRFNLFTSFQILWINIAINNYYYLQHTFLILGISLKSFFFQHIYSWYTQHFHYGDQLIHKEFWHSLQIDYLGLKHYIHIAGHLVFSFQ